MKSLRNKIYYIDVEFDIYFFTINTFFNISIKYYIRKKFANKDKKFEFFFLISSHEQSIREENVVPVNSGRVKLIKPYLTAPQQVLPFFLIYLFTVTYLTPSFMHNFLFPHLSAMLVDTLTIHNFIFIN